MSPRPSHDLTRCATVMESSPAYARDVGRTGVLLCHGYTGTTLTLRFWAEAFEAAGYSVRLPRLPGHGTRWQEMNRVEWIDWYECVDDAFRELAHTCDQVAVAGFSMGGALALRLAQHHPDIQALMLVNPAVFSIDRRSRLLPYAARILQGRRAPGSDVKRIAFAGVTPERLSYDWSPVPAAAQAWSLWQDVRANLSRVHQPILLFRSDEDHVVDASSLPIIRARVSSRDVTVVPVHDSYHVATVDNDAELIFRESVSWLGARMGVSP